MRVAVTGAAGFVGAAACRALAAAGWEVVPLTRRDWDLTTGPMPAPPRVDVVVHAAAAVTDWGDTTRANVDGTRHVVETFPVARLVHLSTASVYDPFRPTVLGREDSAPVERYLTGYASTKALAERLLAGRPGTIVLRPHAVYGPGDRTLLPRVLGAVRGRTLWIVGDGTARQSLTSIGNLTAAIVLSCAEHAPDGVYNIVDAAPVAVRAALRELLAERGLDVRVRGIPIGVAAPLAVVAEAAFRAVGARRAPRLTRYAISHLAVERTLDWSLARERLGYRPAGTSFTGAGDW